MSETTPIPALTHLEKIQTGLVTALKEGLGAKYLIDIFPDNPDEFDMGKAEKSALVQYTGSRYGAPDDAGRTTQQRRAEFAIHVTLRAIGTPLRAPREIDQVRLAVQARKIQGVLIYATRDGLIDQDGALWKYVVEVACALPAIPLPRRTPTPFVTDFTNSEGN